MLMAAFAPYMSYKAISFMGFDTHHAMSAEQEAKSAIGRPLPIPASSLSKMSAPKILGGGAATGAAAASAALAAGPAVGSAVGSLASDQATEADRHVLTSSGQDQSRER